MFGTDFSPPILLVPHLLCWGKDAHRPLVWILKTVKRELILQRIRRQTRWLDSGSCERGRGYRKKKYQAPCCQSKDPPSRPLSLGAPPHVTLEIPGNLNLNRKNVNLNSIQFKPIQPSIQRHPAENSTATVSCWPNSLRFYILPSKPP